MSHMRGKSDEGGSVFTVMGKNIFPFFPLSYVLSQSIIVDRFLTVLYMLHELTWFSWEFLSVDLMKRSHSYFFIKYILVTSALYVN